MSNTRSLADCVMLLRQSNGDALHELQIMFEINIRLYEITDPALRNLLTKYTSSHDDINLSKLQIIECWDNYHSLKSNDLKAASNIIGGPSPTYTQSTSLIANILSIDLSVPTQHQTRSRNHTMRYSKKRSVRVETSAIQDLFIPDKEPKAIPISELDWRLTSLNNKPSLYTVDELPELLKIAKPMPFGETNDKVIRFLVTKESELILGLEGKPQGIVPAHFQMADLDIEKAMCITAGNIYFNDNDEITRIDHKSGDFRPPFDSLQHALTLLVKAGVKFAPEVFIDKLNDRGGTEKRFAVKGEDITAHYSIGLMQEKLLIDENIYVTTLSKQ